MVTSWMQRVWLGLLLACGGVACSDSTPIGSIECIGERIRCGLTEKQLNPDALQLTTPTDEVSSTGLDVLMPAWSGRPFENVAETSITVVADAEGGLWSFSVPEKDLKMTKLDREGAAIEEHTIEPPKGSRNPDRLRAGLGFVVPAQANSKATVGVDWIRDCDGRASDPPDCQIRELLVFDTFEKAPRRLEMGVNSPLPAHANESGFWLTVSSDFHIDKLDTSANLVWRQTGLQINRGSYDWSLFALGALHPDNELSALVWSGGNGPVLGLDLWKLSASGSIEVRRRIQWFGSDPMFAVDARGRDVIVGSNPTGDLTMMRVLPDGTTEGNLIIREEYVGLHPDGFAVDAEGAAYVMTQAGGREPNEWRELLCQLPATGAARCFTLGEITFSNPAPRLLAQMVVPEPGVVYVLSGSDLRRYELPDQ